MIPRTRRRLPRALALLGTTAAVAAGGLAVAVPATQAASSSWSCFLAPGTGCPDDRHSLVAVSASAPSSRQVFAVGSFTANGSQPHGQWWTGYGYTCRVYGGGNVLYPVIRNGSSGNSTVYGWSSWGTGAQSC